MGVFEGCMEGLMGAFEGCMEGLRGVTEALLRRSLCLPASGASVSSLVVVGLSVSRHVKK